MKKTQTAAFSHSLYQRLEGPVGRLNSTCSGLEKLSPPNPFLLLIFLKMLLLPPDFRII